MTPQLHLRKVDSTPVIDQRTNKLIGIGNYLLNHFGCIDEFTALLEGSPVNAGILIAIPAGLRDKSYTLSYDYTTAYENASKLNGQLPQFLENHFKLMVTECILGIDNPEIDKGYEATQYYIENNVNLERWTKFWSIYKQCYYSCVDYTIPLPGQAQPRCFGVQVISTSDLDNGIEETLKRHTNIKPTVGVIAILRECLLARNQARRYGGIPNYPLFIARLTELGGLSVREAKALLGI